MKDLWVPLSGAIAQQKNTETIANNVANINTPGFKKDQLVFKEHLTAFQKFPKDIDLPNKEWKPEDFYRSYGAEHAYVKVDGNYINFEQGELTPTSNPLDLAVFGKGFFEILSPNGIRYSRKGTFTISNEGSLTTEEGFPVLSLQNTSNLSNDNSQVDPRTRVIKLPPGKVRINLDGEIFSNNQKIADLSVIEFKDIHVLKKEGKSLFINPHFNNIKTTSNSRVHQGFIEQSNVNAMHEMSALIKANRQFESIQRVMKAYDNISGKSVNEISRF